MTSDQWLCCDMKKGVSTLLLVEAIVAVLCSAYMIAELVAGPPQMFFEAAVLLFCVCTLAVIVVAAVGVRQQHPTKLTLYQLLLGVRMVFLAGYLVYWVVVLVSQGLSDLQFSVGYFLFGAACCGFLLLLVLLNIYLSTVIYAYKRLISADGDTVTPKAATAQNNLP